MGAMAKGRSSSFRINGLLRATLPFLLVCDMALAFNWIGTKSNPADHPSRFEDLPAREPLTRWAKSLGMYNSPKPGLEVFAGTGRISKAHRRLGLDMLEAIEIMNGSDAFDREVDKLIENNMIGWLWLSPPCCSFSPLRNLDVGGPLRPHGLPEGDESIEEIRLGNALWRRALELAKKAHQHRIPLTIEHPKNPRAWQLEETKGILNLDGVKLESTAWCIFADENAIGINEKATRLLSSFPWLPQVLKSCGHSHTHSPPLRGVRAKAAAAYPWKFCRELSKACRAWFR